ncbi:MAG TPA: hypothetical protein VKM55_11170 [Candidatus Lokiarchaeia archaeon]|nr:hypothetical protein [Candidatus Lokiarchaeia archaeon]
MTIRKGLKRDPEVARSIPSDATIENVHKIEITEALRLAIEYPRLFSHYKGQTIYAARITCLDPETSRWMHHVVFINKKGKILLVT